MEGQMFRYCKQDVSWSWSHDAGCREPACMNRERIPASCQSTIRKICVEPGGRIFTRLISEDSDTFHQLSQGTLRK